MRSLRVTTVSLTLLNVALALLVVLLWNRGQARVTEPERLVVPPLPLPDLAALNSVPMRSVEVATIRDQAVFYASRSFYQPPAAPTEVPPPDYEMAGTLRLADGKRIAFVRRKADRSSRTVHLGDDLEGWRVEAIEPARIVIGHNEQSAELHSNSVASPSGLIRSTGSPHIAQTGIRVLSATGSGAFGGPAHSTSSEARTFHPPPAVGK